MQPSLMPGVFVFATLPPGGKSPPEPLMSFREAEGLTLIFSAEEAEAAGLRSVFRCRMITLEIHSSLKAVGFLAAITTELAAAGIGVNPVSAFYHDHLFVAEDRAAEVMDLLRGLSARHAALTGSHRAPI